MSKKSSIDIRAVKLGLGVSALFFVGMLFFLKPYLPRAVYYNFASIDDEKIFAHRVIKKGIADPFLNSTARSLTLSSELKQELIRLKTRALLVLENGQIRFENQFEEFDRSGSFSIAKSVVATLIQFAIQDQKIRSLSDPVSVYLPEWAKREEGNIKIAHLMQMSSGLNWDESYKNPFSITTEAYYGEYLMATTLRQRLSDEPGKSYKYQSGSTQLLGLIVTRATGQTLSDYLSEKLWSKIGFESDATWWLDHENGLEKAYCCISATLHDYARFGEFIRLKGKWKGQQILDESKVDEMITPKLTPFYGYQWWIFQHEKGPIPYARGILGQSIIIIPWQNRVLVRLGHERGERIGEHPSEVGQLIEWSLSEP